MAVLYAEIPAGLHRALKMGAIARGVPMREFVEDLLFEALRARSRPLSPVAPRGDPA